YLSHEIIMIVYNIYYPQLKNENQWQSIDNTKDSMKNINVKENINQIPKHDTPLLHNVV
ncbi:unnamed protein product, partial [Rotaria socialis]